MKTQSGPHPSELTSLIHLPHTSRIRFDGLPFSFLYRPAKPLAIVFVAFDRSRSDGRREGGRRSRSWLVLGLEISFTIKGVSWDLHDLVREEKDGHGQRKRDCSSDSSKVSHQPTPPATLSFQWTKISLPLSSKNEQKAQSDLRDLPPRFVLSLLDPRPPQLRTSQPATSQRKKKKRKGTFRSCAHGERRPLLEESRTGKACLKRRRGSVSEATTRR